MEELIKIVKHFFYRDFAYILSGGIAIWSFLYLFNRSDLNGLATPYWLFLAGLAYVLGYALQDGFSAFTPFTTTAFVSKPNRYIRWLYGRFEQRAWEDINTDKIQPSEAWAQVTMGKCEELKSELNRVSNLLIIASTMGSGILVASIFLLIKSIITHNSFDISLTVLGIILAFVLLSLSLLKGAQFAKMSCEFAEGMKLSKLAEKES
jgi:hypothetical protein